MILTHKESDEVLYPDEDVIALSTSDLYELKQMAKLNTSQKIRLCAHQHPQQSLHEMFIVHAKGFYVRPHKHLGKVESMSVLEGEVDVVLFQDDGSIYQIVEMGPPGSGKKFYNRLGQPIYHTLLIRTDFLIFHEITEGPFLRKKTIFPDWAPLEGKPDTNGFVTDLIRSVEKLKEN